MSIMLVIYNKQYIVFTYEGVLRYDTYLKLIRCNIVHVVLELNCAQQRITLSWLLSGEKWQLKAKMMCSRSEIRNSRVIAKLYNLSVYELAVLPT